MTLSIGAVPSSSYSGGLASAEPCHQLGFCHEGFEHRPRESTGSPPRGDSRPGASRRQGLESRISIFIAPRPNKHQGGLILQPEMIAQNVRPKKQKSVGNGRPRQRHVQVRIFGIVTYSIVNCGIIVPWYVKNRRLCATAVIRYACTCTFSLGTNS